MSSAICFNLDQSEILLSDNGLRQDDFQRFPIFLRFVAMATRVFEGIKFFQETLKRTMAGKFLRNFI